MTKETIKEQAEQFGISAVIHRHKWDTHRHPIFATCIKCGCKRIAEKYSTGMGWIYTLKKGRITAGFT